MRNRKAFLTIIFFCMVSLSSWSVNDAAGNASTQSTAAIAAMRVGQIGSWFPPIGIPDPGFGILDVRPERPQDWNIAIPGFYYVDEQSGTDVNNSYGMPLHPRRTIPNPISAGSYVEVHGTYTITEGGATFIHALGTSAPWVANVSGPVWIVSQDDMQRAIFTQMVVMHGQYLYVDSVNVRSQNGSVGRMQIGSAGVSRAADHMVVRYCDIQGDGLTGITGFNVVGRSDGRVSDVVIYKNSIYNYGDMNASTDQDAAPMIVEDNASDIWVLENTFHTCTSGFRAGGAYSGQMVDHVYVGRNTIYNTFQAGFAVKYIEDVIFSENDIHHIVDKEWSPAKCIGFQYSPTRFWILYNTIHDCNNGIRSGSDAGAVETPVYIIGNEIYNIAIDGTSPYGQTEGNGIEINGGNGPRYIIGNTIYNTEQAIANEYYAAQLIMSDNIIQNSSNRDIKFTQGYGTGTASTITNTLFTSPAKISWGDGIVRNLTEFQDTYNKGLNCNEGDALFVDPGSDDFSLQHDSPAINAGTEHEVYQLFQDLYGLDIRVDKNGVSRPQGGAWDIGAYEYVPTGPSLNITSPNGGEAWHKGETRTISWNATGVSDNLVIELLQNDVVAGTIASSVDSATGSYSWTVGRLENGSFVTGTNLKIRISTPDGSVSASMGV